MTIGVMVDGKIVQRPYSVASAPAVAGTDGYEFYVRLVEGGTFTPLLWRLPIGHSMRMIGPKGKFMLQPDDERTHIFISSGTGNAPFVAMMRQLLIDGRPRPVVFLNGVSYADELGYRDILDEWEASGELPGHVRPDGLAAGRPAQQRAGSAGPAGSSRSSGRSSTSCGLDAGRFDRLHLRQPGHDPGRRGDAPRARLPRGPGPQGALLAEGQGAARRGRRRPRPHAIDSRRGERRPGRPGPGWWPGRGRDEWPAMPAGPGPGGGRDARARVRTYQPRWSRPALHPPTPANSVVATSIGPIGFVAPIGRDHPVASRHSAAIPGHPSSHETSPLIRPVGRGARHATVGRDRGTRRAVRRRAWRLAAGGRPSSTTRTRQPSSDASQIARARSACRGDP